MHMDEPRMKNEAMGHYKQDDFYNLDKKKKIEVSQRGQEFPGIEEQGRRNKKGGQMFKEEEIVGKKRKAMTIKGGFH